MINTNSTYFDFSREALPDSKEDGLDSDISFEYL